METTSAKAMLVEPRDLDAEFAAITATIPRSEVEAALDSEESLELYLDVKRVTEDDEEERTLNIAWERGDLERLLADAYGDAITFSFAHDQLARAFDDVEAHGLRESVAVLMVAAAAATGAAGVSATAAYAGVDEGTGVAASPIVQVSHNEAQTASQLAAPANDEASLAARGIQAGAAHDEASLASRGIEAPVAAVAHDEALTASQLPTTPANDEATLASRGVEATPFATHDEATLASRGIQPTPADTGSGFEMPSLDATTAAVTSSIAGFALLITAAGFAARRGRGPTPA